MRSFDRDRWGWKTLEWEPQRKGNPSFFWRRVLHLDTVNRDAAGNSKLLISLFFVEEFFVCHFYLDWVVLLLPLKVADIWTLHPYTVRLALALLPQQPPLYCGTPQNIGTKLQPRDINEARLWRGQPCNWCSNSSKWCQMGSRLGFHAGTSSSATPNSKNEFLHGPFSLCVQGLSNLEKIKLHLQTVVILGLVPPQDNCYWLKVIQTSQSMFFFFFLSLHQNDIRPVSSTAEVCLLWDYCRAEYTPISRSCALCLLLVNFKTLMC